MKSCEDQNLVNGQFCSPLSMLQMEHVKTTSKLTIVLYCITRGKLLYLQLYLFFLVLFEVVRVIGLAVSVEQACPEAPCMFSFRLQLSDVHKHTFLHLLLSNGKVRETPLTPWKG